MLGETVGVAVGVIEVVSAQLAGRTGMVGHGRPAERVSY